MNPEPKVSTLLVFLPDAFQGWDADEPVHLNEPKDLYNYIDGGAELYLSYGFKEGLSRTYRKESQPDVTAEIFDLSEARNAFGVFSQTRESENLQLGQGAYSIPGAVFFWKDHYYISLSSWESATDARDLMLALGGFIADKIHGTGEVPVLVKVLPEKGLIPYAYLYFHHYIWLNSYFFISHENLLNIDDTTHALLARYSDGENRKYLLLIQYLNEVTASDAFQSFGRAFFPEGLTDNCLMLEDKSWMAAALKGNLIVAVFNGRTRQSVHLLLDEVQNKY